MPVRSKTIARAVATAAVAVGCLIGSPGVATASGDPVIDNGDVLVRVESANGSHITRTQVVTDENDQQMIVWVYSGAMDREIPIRVQRPNDTSEPRPVLYLLNGAGGGEDGSDWKRQTKAMQFLADKNVNVVTPLVGKFSYYADWVRPDPVLGNYKWQTFLTEELPPIIDAGLGTTGKNALAGLSTSGTTVLALPIAKPGLYESVAAYSGCAQISDPLGYEIVRIGVDVWGGGNADNMYGPPGDPMWAANDPYVNAEKLRGLPMYISSGSGLPGKYDELGGEYTLPGVDGYADQVVLGGVIEAGTNACSHNLKARLDQLGIPATYNFPPTGTHSWGYWEDDLKNSWPLLSTPLGI